MYTLTKLTRMNEKKGIEKKICQKSGEPCHKTGPALKIAHFKGGHHGIP